VTIDPCFAVIHTACDHSITRETEMRPFLFSIGLLAAWGTLWGGNPQGLDQALVKRAAVIKPAAEELRWQQIPWLTDLTEGQRLAKAEGRPIFLWVTGDDPLERC
jgi:hypothetical protein